MAGFLHALDTLDGVDVATSVATDCGSGCFFVPIVTGSHWSTGLGTALKVALHTVSHRAPRPELGNFSQVRCIRRRMRDGDR
jgi:hypothetical protein